MAYLNSDINDRKISDTNMWVYMHNLIFCSPCRCYRTGNIGRNHVIMIEQREQSTEEGEVTPTILWSSKNPLELPRCEAAKDMIIY